MENSYCKKDCPNLKGNECTEHGFLCLVGKERRFKTIKCTKEGDPAPPEEVTNNGGTEEEFEPLIASFRLMHQLCYIR